MQITPLTISGSDERGFTSEYLHERTGNQLIVFRKAGTISGRHYHKGISATKNPEVFIILNGTAIVNWRNINDTAILSATVTGPVKLEIYPYTWHELIAETD